MKKFNELVVANQTDVTEGEKIFLETHQVIMRSGNIMAEFAVSLACNLKKMRDEKLYTAAGFNSFDEYAEDAVGLKRSQAQNYIKVIERLGIDFVQSTGQNFGITKLELLSRLSDDDREQITTQVKVEDESVSELKRRIKELEQEKQDTQDDTAFESELQNEIANLQDEIRRLKDSKKVEFQQVTVVDEKSIAELAAAKNELASQEDLLKSKEEELVRIKKQLEHSGDQNLVRFKIKFEELQNLVKDVLSCLASLGDDKQTKCRQALKAVVEGLAI